MAGAAQGAEARLRCVPSTGPAAPSLSCCWVLPRAALALPDSAGTAGHSWRAADTRAHASGTFGCSHPTLGGGDVLGRWGGSPWDGACWGVLVMRTVVLEASCPVQLPRAGRLRAGELLVTLCPVLWLLPPGWHGVTDRLPGDDWCQMGTDLPWATHPSLMTITAWHCQAL